MKSEFWDNHYKRFGVHESSLFTKFCLSKYLSPDDILIELGCGNGRDGIAMSGFVFKYIGFEFVTRQLVLSNSI